MLVAAIASISLIVGGIGIMNIMLVSVVERTREIGIRMAVERVEAISVSVSVEAITLSGIGGVIGIGLGITASASIAARSPNGPSSSWKPCFWRSAVTVGVVFGLIPPRVAPRSDRGAAP